MPSISAVLPAYNEEGIIADTVRSVAAVLQRIADDYEIIVVNDGSGDRTEQIVLGLAVQNPAVRCISHPTNQGYGAALSTGFSATTRDLIFLTDGDKQFDVRELAGFLTHSPQCDMVIGYRRPRRDPFLRRLYGWGWSWLVGLLFGYTARDVDCAFKLFRRSVWGALKVHSRGATFSAELLVKARRRGFRICELPVSHYPRLAGKATGARISVIVRAFKELLWLRLNLNRMLSEETPLAAA